LDTFKNTYLSLGSNHGDRLNNLQKAVDQITKQIGFVKSVSPIYQTAAMGFEGPDFYNICIELRTHFNKELLLNKILTIETQLGRKRIQTTTYESRVIDIDILLLENEISKSKNLKIPHPEMLKRNFVLKPLTDIAPSLIHPVNNKTISNLLFDSNDYSKVKKLDVKINKSHTILEKYNYIAIEGNIGAGKTTLTSMLTNQFNAKQVLERFADNPFLPKFYEDEERFAFPLEMSFLADRYQQLSDDLAQFDLFKSFIISDYYIFKSLIFSQVTLSKDEYALYRRIFDVMYKEITKPDLYIYLYQNTERLLKNIKKRGRDYEQNIEASYLEKIHKGYANFIQSEQNLNTLIIDVSNLDFVNNPEDYLIVLNKITENKL
jgi:2-amino-4-hydroxy-6-hydroxymethyldihydropteridine diphosphokinase